MTRRRPEPTVAECLAFARAASIEWTERSVNPIRARGPNGKSGHYCVKCSPGCKNCYSSDFQPRLGLPVFQEQAKDPPELYLDPKTLAEVLKRKAPTTWFWCSMTDLFGEWVPDEWIAACFGVMAATPHHTHQVLTKRPERAAKWFEWYAERTKDAAPAGLAVVYASQWLGRSFTEFMPDLVAQWPCWPLPNVWLGTSVENQRYADERIPHLLRCPAAVRFLSCEPLLGPLDLGRWIAPRTFCGCGAEHDGDIDHPCNECGDPANGLITTWGEEAALAERNGRTDGETQGGAPIGWCIVGGESGRGARDFELAWARSLRDQCEATGTAFFCKQLGRAPLRHFADDSGSRRLTITHPKGGDPAEWPEDLRVRQFPEVRP